MLSGSLLLNGQLVTLPTSAADYNRQSQAHGCPFLCMLTAGEVHLGRAGVGGAALLLPQSHGRHGRNGTPLEWELQRAEGRPRAEQYQVLV